MKVDLRFRDIDGYKLILEFLGGHGLGHRTVGAAMLESHSRISNVGRLFPNPRARVLGAKGTDTDALAVEIGSLVQIGAVNVDPRVEVLNVIQAQFLGSLDGIACVLWLNHVCWARRGETKLDARADPATVGDKFLIAHVQVNTGDAWVCFGNRVARIAFLGGVPLIVQAKLLRFLLNLDRRGNFSRARPATCFVNLLQSSLVVFVVNRV